MVVERDVREFLASKGLLLFRWLFVIFQIIVFGAVMSRLVVRMDNWYQYYATGVMVMALYSTAISIGYAIYEEADHGVVEYLLGLPLTRKELVLGRAIAGAVRGVIHVAPIVAAVMLIIGLANPVNYLLAMLSLFLFAFGVSGFSITMVVGLKSGDKFDIIMGALDATIIRLSTAIYPKAFMPQPVLTATDFNPVTYASDLFRWAINFDTTFLGDPLIAALAITLFISTFTFFAVVMYERSLEGSGWR